MMPQRTPITVNDQTFERGLLRGEGFILVTFWADWSGSWHMMEPVVEDVITMFNGKLILARCDVDDSRGTLERFGILSPPALLLFKGGELLDRIFPVPLHFFTTHLKAHPDEESSIRRAAEARAISNFFATAFLSNYPQRPYVLVGDMNEDIDRPRTYEQQAIQSMTGPGTGLRLTTPRNPVTQDERSWSIRNASLSIRLDYILPGGLLFSNLMEGQIFRSDKVSPLPPSLQAGASAAGADHLPVWMVFGNPYDGISTDTPPSIYGLTHSVTLANTVWFELSIKKMPV